MELLMGTIKLILVLALLGGLVYIAAEVIPPYFANYQFQDDLDNEARLGTYSTKGDDIIRDAVFKKAQDLEIPITRDQIRIQRTGASGSGGVMIEADYSVHVELPGYPLDLHFHPQTKNKSAF
jgi:hypothetical protein